MHPLLSSRYIDGQTYQKRDIFIYIETGMSINIKWDQNQDWSQDRNKIKNQMRSSSELNWDQAIGIIWERPRSRD